MNLWVSFHPYPQTTIDYGILGPRSRQICIPIPNFHERLSGKESGNGNGGVAALNVVSIPDGIGFRQYHE